MLNYCHQIASGVSTVLLWSWHMFVHVALAVLLSWIPCRKLSNDNLCKIVQSRLSMICSKLRTMDPRSPWWPPEQAAHYVPPLSPLAPKQSQNDEHWRMNLHSCRTYIRKRTVLNTTATTLDTVAKPACSLNHIPKSPYYQSLTDPLLSLIPSKPQSRGSCLLPALQVRTYWSSKVTSSSTKAP